MAKYKVLDHKNLPARKGEGGKELKRAQFWHEGKSVYAGDTLTLDDKLLSTKELVDRGFIEPLSKDSK